MVTVQVSTTYLLTCLLIESLEYHVGDLKINLTNGM